MKLFKALTISTGILLAGLIWTESAMSQERMRLPPGSYRETCDRLDIRRDEFGEPVLVGVCRSRDGRPRRTSVSLLCRGEIVNENGHLRCDQRGPGSHGGNRPGAGPDWNGDDNFGRPPRLRAPITIYEHKNFRGRSVTIDGPIRDLKRVRMNGMITSVRIPRGAGAWEFCDRSNFRGRCQVLDGSLDNFHRIDLNDSVSSVRPVR
ncbi:MAG: beta/gamma crystallin-related protein [Phyllobacterium sp.]